MNLNSTELKTFFSFCPSHSALHQYGRIQSQAFCLLYWGTFRGYLSVSSSQRFGRRWIERRWRRGWSSRTDRDVRSSCSTSCLIHSQRRWKEHQPFLLLLPLLLPMPAEPRIWKLSSRSCCRHAASYENFMSIFSMAGSYKTNRICIIQHWKTSYDYKLSLVMIGQTNKRHDIFPVQSDPGLILSQLICILASLIIRSFFLICEVTIKIVTGTWW